MIFERRSLVGLRDELEFASQQLKDVQAEGAECRVGVVPRYKKESQSVDETAG
jgi:hypothetical protein